MTSVERVDRSVPRAEEPALVLDRRPVDVRGQLQALRRFWRTIVAFTLLGLLAAAAYSAIAQPTYQVTTTFFVASNITDGSALQADEYAQRRINSYVGVIESERFAQVVLTETSLPLTTRELRDEISASADPDTVLFTVNVRDVSPDRAMVIARSVAANVDETIGQLDNRNSRSFVQIRPISGPTLVEGPVSPRVKLNLALGLLLGLAVGIAQALLRHHLDRTVRTPEQLARVTELPTLGWLNFDRGARRSPILDPAGDHSRRAEDFRQLRTQLRFADAARHAEVLVVTSAVEEEARSTTAANLAISFSETGRRTLLVDADLRNPELHRHLGLPGDVGLTTVLAGEVALADAVRPWGNDHLRVLTSGKVPSNPSELLGSAAMERLVAEARSQYDLVVIDTPPVLPVTDAAVTSVLADGVLLLVRFGKTHVEKVQRALGALGSVDAQVLGTVVTMARDDQQGAVAPSAGTWA